MTVPNYIRNVFLQVGPFTEVNEFIEGNRVDVFSDGSRDGLKIAFSVEKTLTAAPNKSSIEVYNLNGISRGAIVRRNAGVKLQVGYKKDLAVLLARGGVLSGYSSREGTDIKTTINFLDGYETTSNSTINATIGPGVAIKDLVYKMAQNLEGVTVSKGRIKLNDSRIGSRGRVFSGRLADEMNNLAREYGFSWSVQDGVFQALSDKQTFNKTHKISYKNGTLMSANPILSGAQELFKGVEITAIMNPTILPGDNVILETDIDWDLDGKYKVYKVSYTGDTFDNNWEMKITSHKIFEGIDF